MEQICQNIFKPGIISKMIDYLNVLAQDCGNFFAKALELLGLH